METKRRIAITGAFGYSGKTITDYLLSDGYDVKNADKLNQ
jgi:nucleoside-diphosphate-sugar epimerase